jgi:hypothetical protein
VLLYPRDRTGERLLPHRRSGLGGVVASAAFAPDGMPHGAEGACVTRAGEVVLVGNDHIHWSLPAGRPEARETWLETLRREVLERHARESWGAGCVWVHSRGCTDGAERGQVLVRSVWRAEVELAA